MCQVAQIYIYIYIYITIINFNLLIIMIRVVRGVMRCDFGPFLAKTIIAPHLIFAVTCAVRCNV